MVIYTKFDLGDDIWCISGNKIKNMTIIGFTAKPSDLDIQRLDMEPYALPKIEYETSNHDIINEKDCFETKQDLIDSLIK